MRPFLLSSSALEVADGLWVGPEASALHPPEQVQAVLSLTGHVFDIEMADRVWLRLPMPDGPRCQLWQMQTAVEFLECVHQRHKLPTLVHCQAGLSRSVTVASTYLHLRGVSEYAELQQAMVQLAVRRGGNPSMVPTQRLRQVAAEFVQSRGGCDAQGKEVHGR